MLITPEVRSEIVAEYEKNPSRFMPGKAARKVGVSVGLVLEVVRALSDPTTSLKEAPADGSERDDLEPYIVARRVLSHPWDNDDPDVAAARAAYAAGTHEMASHRRGDIQFLCLFPRRKPVKGRENYFKLGV